MRGKLIDTGHGWEVFTVEYNGVWSNGIKLDPTYIGRPDLLIDGITVEFIFVRDPKTDKAYVRVVDYYREPSHSDQMIDIMNLDRECQHAAEDYAKPYGCPSDDKMCKHDVISAFNNGAKWMRDHLKKPKTYEF